MTERERAKYRREMQAAAADPDFMQRLKEVQDDFGPLDAEWLQWELPRRKANRLKAYDYGCDGAYFLTICVKEGHPPLSSIVVGARCTRPHLTGIGSAVEREIARLSETYTDMCVDAYVIMPNHVHMIVVIDREDGGRVQSGRTDEKERGRMQCAPTVSKVVQLWKSAVTKRVGQSIWQKSFYDHIIRDEADHLRVREYIDNNPAKWAEDVYFQK